MKRWISVLLVCCMLVTLMPAAFAGDAAAATLTEPVSGYCGGEGDGTNLTWTLTADGTLTISGTGKMADYSYQTPGPWYDYANSVTKIVLESGVTTLGSNAFTGIGTAESVELPEGLLSIGQGAFFNCFGLSEINIPASVTSIGHNAIYNCDRLTRITVAEGNTVYCNDEYGALFNKAMTTLIVYPAAATTESYTIPAGVTSIRGEAFRGCSNLKSVVISYGITKIESSTFIFCRGLAEVTIPRSVTEIDMYAFSGCALTDVYYGGTEEDWAAITVAEGNDPISSATIHCTAEPTEPAPGGTTPEEPAPEEPAPEGPVLASGTCGGEGDGTNLTWVLTSDGTLTISGTGIMADYVGDTMAPWKGYIDSISGIVVESGVTALGSYAFHVCRNAASVELPEGLLSIGRGAFFACGSLSEITIPASVILIGDSAIYNCSGLKKITVAEGNTAYCNDEYGVLFSKDMTTLIRYPQAGSAEAYTIPNGVTCIAAEAFCACGKLKSVEIPAGVTEIGAFVFLYCGSLTEITIPAGVTKIDWYAFGYCDALTDVCYGGTEEDWAVITIEEGNDPLSTATIHCMDLNQASVAEEEGTITFEVHNLNQTVTMIFAFYDQYGRMCGIKVETAVEGDYEVELPEGAVSVSAFLLSEEWFPLIEMLTAGNN